ncbi:MAG: GNAT family N-acetyltransferase [Dehalococcoidia bacterium]|nr:GNAT family N-acetyltransferase [Dehalococcoidia bacterium]
MTPDDAASLRPEWIEDARADLHAVGVVPTESALRAYVARRLRRPHAEAVIDPALGGRALVAPSPFDTQHLGVRVATVIALAPGVARESAAAPHPPAASGDGDWSGLASAIAAWADANADLLIVRQPLANLAAIQALETMGFRLMDVQTPLALRLSAPVAAAPRDDAIHVADVDPATDIEPIVAFAARAFRDSHFYANRRLDPARCDALYAAWVRNDCAGRAFLALKATVQDEIVGFFAGVEDPIGDQILGARRAHIDLVVTKDSWRGRGVGVALVEHGLAAFAARGVTFVTVSTQATNARAIRLYLGFGFRLTRPTATLHRWTAPDFRAL